MNGSTSRMDKLSFLIGTWVGETHVTFYRDMPMPVDDKYEFKIGPGDSFISYFYTKKYERFGVMRPKISKDWSDSGYIGIHPSMSGLLMYNFCSNGSIRRGLEVSSDDPNDFLFQGTMIPTKHKWQTKIKQFSEDEFVLTSIQRIKRAFCPVIESHYVRSVSTDLAIRQFDEVMEAAGAVDWSNLFDDMCMGKVREAAESAITPMDKAYFPSTLYSSGVLNPSYHSRSLLNHELIERLRFPEIKGDFGKRLSKFYRLLEELGIDKDKLDHLASVYPASGGSE